MQDAAKLPNQEHTDKINRQIVWSSDCPKEPRSFAS
jgi:hypothetical protein